MDKPIRVLQILGIVGGGGVEAVIMNYYEHINRDKVQFDFIVHENNIVDITDKVSKMGGHVYKVPAYNKNVIGFMWSIYKIVRKHHYQIIHSNMNTLSVFSLFPAWLAGAKIRILHNHSTSVPSETKRNFAKLILRPFAKIFANQYFACSEYAARWMFGSQLVDANKVKIINNAVDLSKYAFNQSVRDELREQLALNDKFVIGHVGRFMYQKNHEFLIDIFKEFNKKVESSVLLLIGDGPLKKRMEEKVHKLGLDDKVIFLGLRSDVEKFYNVMDIFVLPSFYEGLPVVGVECQANSLPILSSTNVTREMQITELINFKELSTGSAAWADEIVKYYLKNNQRINRNMFMLMSQKNFNIDLEAQKLVEFYQGVLR